MMSDLKKTINCIIVDDEPIAREILENHLKKIESISVKGSCKNAIEAFNILNVHDIDLIFLDINMPEISGLSFAKSINKKIKIIFTTAYREYALDGFDLRAVDYLLKPIGKTELAESINKALDRQQEQITYEQLLILRETLKNLELKKLPTRIAFSTSDGIHYKLVDDIMYLEAQANYTKITFDGTQKSLLTSKNIGEYEDQFNHYTQIRRTHRSYIVNLSFVDTYVRKDGGYLIMKDGEKIPVSRKYRDDIEGGLDGL